MKVHVKRGLVIALSLLIVACGVSTKNDPGDLEKKKAELQDLRNQQNELASKITALEEEIAKIDPSTVAKPRFVAVTPLETQAFSHFVDLQGRVTTTDIYQVTPRGQGGQVKAIYVREGDRVRKGQLLLKLEDAVIKQQLDQAKIQLAYLQDIYNRRKNLWDQNIGTEVELLNAKNSVSNQQKQIDLLNDQLSFTNVYAEVSGVIETLTIRVGEQFGGPMGGITIVNTGSLKASVDVPESYLARIKKGAPVEIDVPDIGKTFHSSISLISQVINANSRGFTAEARIPGDPGLKPNQIAIMHIRDYSAKNSIVVPLTTLQTDENGKFVYVMVNEQGKTIARKKPVEVGHIYGEKIEVLNGLQAGDQLISQGFQSLYDGQLVTTVQQ